MGDSAVRYQVVILGFQLNGAEPPAKVLERVLGMNPNKAQELTRSFPCVVGVTANPEHARIHAERLRQAGAKVEVREHTPGQPARAPSPPPSMPKAAPPPPPAPPAGGIPSAQAPGGNGYALGDLVIARNSTPQPATPETSAPKPQVPASAPLSAAEKAALPDAFSGMRSYENDFADDQPEVQLELDQRALRENRPVAAVERPPARKPLSLGERLARLPRLFFAWLMSWVPHTIALGIVVVISAAAVCYGLDPDHILDDVAVARARQATEQLLAPVVQLLPPQTPR